MLPLRQLVVIGEPGAGKSVLGLMLAQQLHTRAADEPVPVLLAVSSWNPVAESVEQFVAGGLADDFGFSRRVAKALAGEARPGARCAWWVMPVLDGLDEIPAVWRELAVQRVEQFTALDRPVVVTCRVLEWERAEAGAGALSRAAVVRLEPLRPDDVIEFLSEPAARKPLWEPVFARLRAQPSSLLADVLATPLMAGLARDRYSHNGDPSELTAMATRSAVMACLIDGYVDVVYREGSWPQGGSSRGISVTAAMRCGGCRIWRSWPMQMARGICGGGGCRGSNCWPARRGRAHGCRGGSSWACRRWRLQVVGWSRAGRPRWSQAAAG